MQDGVLVATPSERSRVRFDYEPPDEYDFKVVVTVVKAHEGLNVYYYASGHQGMFVYGGWGNSVSAFETVNGAGGPDNKTAKRRNGWITNGKQYKVVLKVRRTGVEAYVDGQLVTSLLTDFSNVGLDGNWGLAKGNAVGVGIQQGAARFESAEIVELSGEGKLLSP